LPTEQELEARTGVSRVTIKRAMDELVAEGLVKKRRGVGSVVSYSPPPIKAVYAPFVGMLENLEQMGRNTQVRVIAVDRKIPPGHVSAVYQASRPLLHTLRTRSQNDRVFGYYEGWTDIEQVPAQRKLFEQKARLEIFRDAGVVLSEIHQAIKGVAALGMTATHLGVLEGTPLTSIVRWSYDREGKLVDYLEALYNPEFFEYRMEFKTP